MKLSRTRAIVAGALIAASSATGIILGEQFGGGLDTALGPEQPSHPPTEKGN